ncbi:MAG: phosphonate dehydrogenase [Gammaproteobacteria bacterium]
MNRRPKVLITYKVHQQTLDFLETHYEVIANPSREPWPATVLNEYLTDVDAMMAFMPDSVDENFFQQAPNLKVIGCALKGPDNFDIEACTRHGVWITIVPDMLTVPTAELTIGLMLALDRHILAGDTRVCGNYFHGWRPIFYGKGLAGTTVGLYGMGAIGQALTKRLQAFGCKLIYHDQLPLPSADAARLGLQHVELGDLQQQSDYLVLCLPLTARTLHCVDHAFLNRMKSGALLINPCRGSVVDETAVAHALDKHLGGYAADVFEMEDWARPDRPHNIPADLLKQHDRTLFTPHLGSAVATARLAIEMQAARNIHAVLSGEIPDNPLNWVASTTAMTTKAAGSHA